MKLKKRTFDLLFIIISTSLLITFNAYNVLENYIAFALIPILMAYFLGQYSEKTFKNK
ncbi:MULTISPECIES: hypothetical protein [Bizionia]|uniref:hypothetical protein n=1 Tax=Bizionia TaxID=283785 RepID=UPI001478AFB1|nr:MULTISPECIES: hypothetical protein [Bizionia]